MAVNLFRQLRELMPEARVVVGVVIEIREDDTCSVQLPGPGDLAGYAANIFTGSVIRARGSTVPLGERAFVRDWGDGWVIETRAPAGPILDIPIGTVVVPPQVISWTLSASLAAADPDDARIVEAADAGFAALSASLAPSAGTWPYSTLPLDVISERV